MRPVTVTLELAEWDVVRDAMETHLGTLNPDSADDDDFEEARRIDQLIEEQIAGARP